MTLDPAKLPRHVAVLLDEGAGEADLDGAGAEALWAVVEAAAELGLGVLTLCASEALCTVLEGRGLAEAGRPEIDVRLKAERGRAEILDAFRRIADEVRQGRMEARSVDAETIDRFVEGNDAAPLDLLVCTGGRRRLSNYLLWQAAYAEIFVVETPWTELGRADLLEALASYQRRERRFGRVPAPEPAQAVSLSKAG